MMEFKVLLLLLVIAATVIAVPLPQDDGEVDLGLDGALGFGNLERGKRHGSKGGRRRGDKGDLEFGADKSGLEGKGDLAFGVSGGRKRGGKRSKSERVRNNDQS
ncbi:PREDICTED: uncharacterized protein LOC106102513 [Papilio polytes]|uniref:uncharacterized protein LOC106102513 n=1 Tax=Papilio polytes TaxID=76194 RepID=UPI0006768C3B|nr:PREDICTED: uncharacterized protein LOC106102513 [Papilio polytes]